MSSLQCVMCRSDTVFSMYAYIDATCPICLQVVSNVAIFDCGHGVCRDCIGGLEERDDMVYLPRRQLPIPPPRATGFPTNEFLNTDVGNPEAYAHFQGIRPQSIYDTATVEINGQAYIWVKQSFAFYDWTLYDVVTGYIAYLRSEPPPPHSEPHTRVSWSKRSKRWQSL